MARGEATSHEGLIHRMNEFIDTAERQFLIHIGTSNTFEEVKPLHLGLDHDLRDVESDALICGRISRRGRGNDCPPHVPHRVAPAAPPPAPVTDRAVPVGEGRWSPRQQRGRGGGL